MNLGQRLQSARQSQGLSLQDVAYRTKIPVSRLILLEQDNYAAFGSLAYARAFLRLYSRFLEVDASEVLDTLPEGTLGGPRDYRYLIDELGPWVERQTGRMRRAAALAKPLRGSTGNRVLTTSAILVFAVLLVGTVLFARHLVLSSRESSGLVAGQPEAPPVTVLRAVAVTPDMDPALAYQLPMQNEAPPLQQSPAGARRAEPAPADPSPSAPVFTPPAAGSPPPRPLEIID